MVRASCILGNAANLNFQNYFQHFKSPDSGIKNAVNFFKKIP
jgi:hypothetical protein